MTVSSVTFVATVYKPEQVPQPFRPEIAFFGRSNVGKSTLLNTLLGQPLARTSGTPGKTQGLNYYLVNERYYLVDAPGYGYAKLEKKLREAWQRNFEAWLSQNDRLKLVVMIVDARLEVQASDRQMADYLKHHRFPALIVFNKTDKLNRREREKALRILTDGFEAYGWPMEPVSGLTGDGGPAIWRRMAEAWQNEQKL